MRPRLIPLAAAAILALLLSAFSDPGAAGLEKTSLRFQGSLRYRIGDELSFRIRLETEAGRPLELQQVDFYLDGAWAGSAVTDALGAAEFRLLRHYSTGEYTITAKYEGFQLFLPSETAASFTVEPIEIVVQTLPVIAGVAFALDGEVRSTGPDGLARFAVDQTGVYTVELVADQAVLQEAGAVFTRWWPDQRETVTSISVPGVEWVQAGFEMSYTAVFHFVDPDGEPVDGSLIDSATLRGSDGSVYSFAPGETLLLPANRILARLSGLDSLAVIHSVQSVLVDGGEVVHRGQQRFFFSQEPSIEIEVLFYDVRFSSGDLLLGLQIGRELELVHPNGEVIVYALDETGELLVAGLPRGEYEARLVTRSGFAPRLPIVLSRDQEIRLPVVSYADLAAFAAAGAAVVIGLPLFGRRRQILALVRRAFRVQTGGGEP